MTDTKLLLPQNEGSSLYIARNYTAHKDLVVVVLYYYDNYLYYSIVSGSGSGRVHPIYLPATTEIFQFCFHFAVDAISKVNPQIAEELYTCITEKVSKSKKELTDGASKESTTIIQSTT